MSKELSREFARKNGWEFLLDMDGVVADFDAHARAHDKFNDKGQPKWDELDRLWWGTMPPCDGAREFYDAVKAIGPARFLTAPILSVDCFTGKAEWVQKFMPEEGRFALLDLIICPAKDKHFLARPNRILVDDREKNIREWEEAGGIGVHHKGDFTQTLAQIAAITTRAPGGAPVSGHENPEPRIFLNINGVLADFETHAQAHGKIDEKGVPRWTDLDSGWWRTMPAFEGAAEFHEELRKLPQAQVRFLSAPVPTTDGFTGKVEWVQEFLPQRGKYVMQDVIVCRGKDKQLLASGGNILVDDREKDVEDWVKAGGVGILHTGDFAQTLAKVREALARFPEAAAKPPSRVPKI